ncbi:MAG TPA: hypothetical protein VMI31_01765 [Fimbriimonadaceae bacterium]|nr:hypothetical protein [Fimbriimonadaceae bacterium]
MELSLTRDEAEELYIYLHKMLSVSELHRAYLTELSGCAIARELAVSIERDRPVLSLSA